jgi:hypothetical protein
LWIAAVAAGVAAVAGLLVAANPGPVGAGALACPAQRTNQLVLMGVSSSGRDTRIVDERRAEIRHQLSVAAYCKAELIVRAWSTAGAVRTLWSPEDHLDLRGVTVTIEGVGQVAGIPAPAGGEWVPALRTFGQRTCESTGATCTVLSASGRAG